MKQTKRILSISIERMSDDSPDISWLGEYSNKRTSEFSIDRAHDTDCQTQNQTAKDAIDQLERVIAYLDAQRRAIGNDSDNPLYWSLDESCDVIGRAQDELAECDCGRGEWNHREYRYFNPSFNYVDKAGKPLPENTPEDVRKYVKQDYERMESLYRGDWSFIGIGAKAKITVNDTCQTITSGGLWGIESDSEESYLRSVEQEELSDLRTQLYELGFSKRAIATAVKEMN